MRFADLWNHAAFKAARDRLVKDAPEVVEHFTKEMGVGPDEIERITGLMPSLESHGDPLLFVTTTKPYNAVQPRPRPFPTWRRRNSRSVRLAARRPAGARSRFLDDRTFMTAP